MTICLALFMAMLFLLGVLVLSGVSVSKSVAKNFLLFSSIFFVVFAMLFEPQSFIRWDLIEHFKLIDEMRKGGMPYATNESQYADLYAYNWFAYFVSLLPKTAENLLTVIPLVIDFSIVGYIYQKMFNAYMTEADGKTRVLSVFLWLTTFGIKLAISGIRCSLAVSLCALAIYLEMIQKKRRIFSVLLYVISVFIHNFAVVVILVRILSAIKKPLLTMLFALGISFSLEPFARYMVSNIDNEYLSFSFQRVLDTVEKMNLTSAMDEFYGSTLIIYGCFVCISIYLFVVSIGAKHRYQENFYCQRVIDFSATVGAVAIGLSFNYLYLERFMYLVSFALLMIMPICHRGQNHGRLGDFILVPMAFFVFFFNDIYIFMVNYVGSYFLAF